MEQRNELNVGCESLSEVRFKRDRVDVADSYDGTTGTSEEFGPFNEDERCLESPNHLMTTELSVVMNDAKREEIKLEHKELRSGRSIPNPLEEHNM